jgi:thiamine-monophosphate kinase
LSSPAKGASLPAERELIAHIRRRLPEPAPSILIGPGDDAAVVVPERGTLQVLTTDATVEGIHFNRAWSSLADAGYRALAVNLSDLAAMGATASLALLSLALPDWTTPADVDALLDGFLDLALTEKVSLAGGNLCRSPGPMMIDVTALGYVRPRKLLRRSGGRPGDALFVTGSLGEAAAGLAWLNGRSSSLDEAEVRDCIQRHRRPQPRLRVGALLARNRAASACMDLSDGLADAVHQLASASGTGAIIDADRLPVSSAAKRVLGAGGSDAIASAVVGGDDFELLFAVAKKARGRLRHVEQKAGGTRLTCIGELTREPDVLLRRGPTTEPLPAGFSHF